MVEPDVPVFRFGYGDSHVEPDPERLGNKGAGLVSMASAGLPVPPGFIVGTETGARVLGEGEGFREQVKASVRAALHDLEELAGYRFGDAEKPFLVSVRSGAAVSMPGMMDTVLNVGLNDITTHAIATLTGDDRFAWDTYRRFVQSYAAVVLGIEASLFDGVMEEARERHGVESDSELPAEDLRALTEAFREIVAEETGEPFPQDVETQLERAMVAVFRSWNAPTARDFRRLTGVQAQGTAAIVQAMVFGNRDARSCTGVYTTRNPSTGAKEPYGDFIPNAQGEDVVGGAYSGFELTEAARERSFSEGPSMEALFPEAHAALLAMGADMEQRFGAPQEIEFTVESDKLWLLQTRSAKLLPAARVRVAVDMVGEGLISRAEALRSCPREEVSAMVTSRVVPGGDRPVARGLAAGAGAVSGNVVFTSEAAVEAKERGEDVILMRPTTDPRDVRGMAASVGVITSRGGQTSHAAVVARSLNTPCIVGATSLAIDPAEGTCRVLDQTIRTGDRITMDGKSGFLYLGDQPLDRPDPSPDIAALLQWHEEAEA
ncbi:MAG: PEP/pyruvate-binding domain-containing protein [Pseudomonadota bacterium]